MGGFIKMDVERVETTALNTKINKEVFDAFKIRCKQQGYPLNVVLETFMNQFAVGKFKLSTEDIMKFKDDGKEESVLNTTFNKEIYTAFKDTCKLRGLFVKHTLAAFMEIYATGNLVAEYVYITEIK